MKGARRAERDLRRPIELRTVAEVLAEPDRWYVIGRYRNGVAEHTLMRASTFADPSPAGGNATLTRCPASMLLPVSEVPADER